MAKRKIWIFIAVVAVALILLCPFPQQVMKEYTGLAYPKAGGEGVPCTVKVDGTCYRYLVRMDNFWGDIQISTDEKVLLKDEFRALMDYSIILFSADLSNGNPGYLITPDNFKTLYLQVKDAEEVKWEVMAPADSDTAAAEIRAAAARYFFHDGGPGAVPDF